MQKLTATLVLSLVTTIASAWIPDRIFEVGTDVEVGFGNTYFAADDFFNKKGVLVIDLNKMAANLPTDGLAFSLDERARFVTNLNLSPDFRLGLFFQVTSSGYTSLPKALFDLVAKGNGLDKAYTGTFKMRGDVNADLGATFGTNLFGFDVKFGGSYFIPLLHLEKPEASYSWRSNSDGTMVADVVADVPVYSVIPLEGGIDSGKLVGNMFKAGGLDFSVAAEYPLLPDMLLVGGELKNIPLWPGRLEDRTRLVSKAQFSMADAAKNYNDPNLLYKTTQTTTFKSDKAAISVIRPFKLGSHATYLPFGSPIVSLTGNLGLGVYDWVYPEFGLQAQADLWKWLVFRLASQYEDQLWKQKVALDLNLWLVEFDLGVTSQSQDLAKSFGAGLSLNLGVRLGM